MTKRTKPQRPKSGQRRTEKPVDSEIRRAARRAGIEREKLGAAFKAETGVDPSHVELTPTPDPRDLPGFDVLAALVGVSFEVGDALDASIDALRPDGPPEANAETVRAIVHLRRAKQRITRTTNELGKMAREQGGAS